MTGRSTRPRDGGPGAAEAVEEAAPAAALVRRGAPPRTIDAETARRYFVRRHLLAPARSVRGGADGVRAVFARLGSVQFDPLAVAGRNHDLVLHARVADYDPTWTDDLLYATRELFEVYNKGLSLVPTADLPWYRISWERALVEHGAGAFTEHREAVDHVLGRLRSEGPLSSLDFERRAAVRWWWGPTNQIRAVLEALAHAGVVGLARRVGNRRYFELVERLFASELLETRVPVREQLRHKLLSRFRGHGLLGTGGQAELFYGTGRAARDPTATTNEPTRGELLAELVEMGELAAVAIDGIRGVRYMPAAERALLDEAETEDRLPGPPSVTFLAPLDPFVWDREFLRRLFGFDYVWEVYVPEAKRRWGYYVLPLLFGDRLVGRIEPRIDRAGGTVRILGLWWEGGFDPRRADGLVEAVREALAAYLRFAGARRVEWPAGLARERRLFGTQPQRGRS